MVISVHFNLLLGILSFILILSTKININSFNADYNHNPNNNNNNKNNNHETSSYFFTGGNVIANANSNAAQANVAASVNNDAAQSTTISINSLLN